AQRSARSIPVVCATAECVVASSVVDVVASAQHRGVVAIQDTVVRARDVLHHTPIHHIVVAAADPGIVRLRASRRDHRVRVFDVQL
ncbi:hypothetical protein ACO2WH_25910, partial [Escherichia coli]|uniref:hypothetical protein n=1 Tax=Escherichia coli TaxID=562 RepID=UPI003C109615